MPDRDGDAVPAWRTRLLGERLRARLRVVLVAELVLLAVLAGLVWRSTVPDRVDRRVASLLYARPGTTMRAIADAVSLLGKPAVVVLASVLVAGWAWWRTRDLVLAAFAPVAVGVTAALGHALKLVIERPRPATAALAHELDFSYPSGHATGAAALALAVILLVGATRPAGRHVVAALAVAYAVLIALSRLVLGVHYLTDVVAGVATGTAGVLVAGWACATFDLELVRRRRRTGVAG